MGKNRKTSTWSKLVIPIVSVIVLLFVLFVGVLPASRGIEKTNADIVQLNADIKDQKAFLPIYIPLQRRKAEALPDKISVYQLEPLKIEDIAKLPSVFEALARESLVELVSVTPQVRSLKGGRELLRVDALLRGQFTTFNKLLSSINRMKSVVSTESFAIDVTDLGHEMKLSVWLAIK